MTITGSLLPKAPVLRFGGYWTVLVEATPDQAVFRTPARPATVSNIIIVVADNFEIKPGYIPGAFPTP